MTVSRSVWRTRTRIHSRSLAKRCWCFSKFEFRMEGMMKKRWCPACVSVLVLVRLLAAVRTAWQTLCAQSTIHSVIDSFTVKSDIITVNEAPSTSVNGEEGDGATSYIFRPRAGTRYSHLDRPIRPHRVTILRRCIVILIVHRLLNRSIVDCIHPFVCFLRFDRRRLVDCGNAISTNIQSNFQKTSRNSSILCQSNWVGRATHTFTPTLMWADIWCENYVVIIFFFFDFEKEKQHLARRLRRMIHAEWSIWLARGIDRGTTD